MVTIEIIVSEEVEELLTIDQSHLHDYAVYVCESSGFHDVEVNIVFIGDERMTTLNETYKKRKGSTDVLSFNLSAASARQRDESDDVSRCLEGEVYISLERARDQAEEYNVPFGEEVIRLVTHGLLHLCGRVHDTPDAFKSMVEETDTMMEHFNSLRCNAAKRN